VCSLVLSGLAGESGLFQCELGCVGADLHPPKWRPIRKKGVE
jgi:hypothetical protein